MLSSLRLALVWRACNVWHETTYPLTHDGRVGCLIDLIVGDRRTPWLARGRPSMEYCTIPHSPTMTCVMSAMAHFTAKQRTARRIITLSSSLQP